MKQLLLVLASAAILYGQTPSPPWAQVSTLPSAATAMLGMPYLWTAATTANTCPSAGAGGSGGSAQAGCITFNGTSWTSIGGGGGSGTVTSVAQSAPSWLSVAGSPVTTSGTLALTAATGQTAHQVIGTCGTATSFTPCALVAGDIPTISLTAGISGILPAANGGTGVNNTATLTLGSSNRNYATLGTGIIKNTTTTGAASIAAAADVYGLWSGTCSSSTFLRGDGSCQTPSGSGGTGNAASVVTTTFSGTPTFTCPSSSAGTVTTFVLSTALTANITSSTLASCTTGQVLNFVFAQDATGGRTVAMPTGFDGAGVDPIASTTTTLSYAWDGTNARLLNSTNETPSVLRLTTERSAPATPASATAVCWPDSTDHSGLECMANNSASVFKLFLSGADCNPVTGICTKTNGTSFSTLATTTPGTGVATFLATPSSANLAAAITDETGSGLAVFATSPTLTTPTIGVATATSVNKMAITAPATSSTLAVANSKTFTVNNTLTLAGTDSTTMTFPSTSATVARTDAANTFTGHQTIEGVTATGATGTGPMVFGTAPTLDTPAINNFFSATHNHSNAATGGGVPLTSIGAGTIAGVGVFPGADLFIGGVNAQSGTSYTVVTTDENKLTTFNNAASVAVTLPVATTTGFTSGAYFDTFNRGAGVVTITPTTSTINGGSTLVLNQGQGARIVSDGTNYSAWLSASPSGSGTVTTSGSPTTNRLSKFTSSTAVGNSSIADDGTTVSTTENIASPGVSLGGTPPSLTAGTGGALAFAEGTVPSVCLAASVDCLYFDSTQHGPMLSRNGVSYAPIPQGPTSATVGHYAKWGTTSAGALTDGTIGAADLPAALSSSTSINKMSVTAPATSSTIAVADGKTLTANNTLTLAGTDSTTITFQATDTYVGRATTDTLTNKTYDAEGTGNTLTVPFKVWLPGAGCNNATASSFWDLPTSTPAVATCVTGTNTQKGVLAYADTSGGFSAQNEYLLPSDWTGNIDAKIIWSTSATSGNAKFSLSTVCTDVAATATDDAAFNTASTVTTAAPGTANRLQTSSISAVTITGCTASSTQFLHIKLFRDGNDGSDTISATANVVGVELTVRRAL